MDILDVVVLAGRGSSRAFEDRGAWLKAGAARVRAHPTVVFFSILAPRYPVALVRRSGGPSLVKRVRGNCKKVLFGLRFVNRNKYRRPQGTVSTFLLGLDLSAARLADEERPVRRALVVLPPRHMTAALRHRQSRSARLRGQLRPSDDRLAPIAGRGHSPAHHPPADHLSASPRAGRSPARHRRRASPRRHASLCT